ncbi:hypothetical protein D910_04729 [Dendroctonus ponderosae]|uniref:Uncharacterized protein n=1 Tax=Dendroctonus ponderosae TaxID=77166 RepID=U4U0H4_DENPD|nr:hypothetical protein D910_04729 [Dendroctonus ponderosae]
MHGPHGGKARSVLAGSDWEQGDSRLWIEWPAVLCRLGRFSVPGHQMEGNHAGYPKFEREGQRRLAAAE